MKTVLVVDDEPKIVDVVREHLAHHRHRRRRSTSAANRALHRGRHRPGVSRRAVAIAVRPVHQAEGSQGSGLGLAIARDLVTAHGGTIEATNGPAGGAVVSFGLPAV